MFGEKEIRQNWKILNETSISINDDSQFVSVCDTELFRFVILNSTEINGWAHYC